MAIESELANLNDRNCGKNSRIFTKQCAIKEKNVLAWRRSKWPIKRRIKEAGNLSRSVASGNQGTDVYRETSGQNTREIGTRAYFSSVTQSVCAAVHLEPSDVFRPVNKLRGGSRAGSSHRTFNFIVSPHGSPPIKRRASKTIRDGGNTDATRGGKTMNPRHFAAFRRGVPLTWP